MLSSYPIACPHHGCGWAGNLVPSQIRGGVSAEIASSQRAWFLCPRCQRNWEMMIQGEKVVMAPVAEQESSPSSA
jgi:hypothetical protein